MKIPNVGIKELAAAAIIENHEKFSRTGLASEFVPSLMMEASKGWKESESWLMNHFSTFVTFLQDRGLVLESYVDILHKYFDVLSSYTSN